MDAPDDVPDEMSQAVRDEIVQLVADGLIEPTGDYRPRRDGSMAPVHAITALGREVAALLAAQAEGED